LPAASASGAQPPSEFGGRQTPVAVEAAKKILCHGFAFLGVAFHAARNEIAVGIGPHAGKRHDMVEATHVGGEPAQTIEAKAAIARMDGRAPRVHLQEIHLLDAGAALVTGQAGDGNFSRLGDANFSGQANLDERLWQRGCARPGGRGTVPPLTIFRRARAVATRPQRTEIATG